MSYKVNNPKPYNPRLSYKVNNCTLFEAFLALPREGDAALCAEVQRGLCVLNGNEGMEKKMETLGPIKGYYRDIIRVYRGYIGIMEKKVETTIGLRV